MTERISLDRPVRIVGGDAHPHAARQIERGLGGRAVPVAVDGALDIRLRMEPGMPEGAFSVDVPGDGAIEIVGGPFSGVIYGANTLVGRIAPEDLSVPVGRIDEEPGLPYRTWWNWDHSTNWSMTQIGAQNIGVMNPYAKPPEGFLADFKRVVDYMSLHRIAAITIFGFLRDSHGGIGAAQELCRYATERGVRILPGIAINAYGGVVWDMDHEFNLATWLRKHPELAAQMEHQAGFQLKDLSFPLFFPKGDYSVRGCSSRPENVRWMDEATAWLAETFQIGGVNIEAGDYGVCGCGLCAARRAEREDASRRKGYAESWSHADMADYYPRLLEIIKARHPDAWVYSEIQWDNLLDFEAQRPLAGMPDGGIYQHTLNRSYWKRVEREITPEYAATLPTRINVLRTQFNCQWNGDYRTERYRLNARDIAAQSKKAAEIGFRGHTIWGEVSSYETAADLGYRAFARFTWDPDLTWEQFLAEDLAPLFDGVEGANRYVALNEAFDASVDIPIPELAALRSETLANAAATSGDVSARWLWLSEQIERRRFDAETRPVGSPW
jgi:hypothetical protein